MIYFEYQKVDNMTINIMDIQLSTADMKTIESYIQSYACSASNISINFSTGFRLENIP